MPPKRKRDLPELPLNTVFQADCRQKLLELPEKSIDLIFADPPYNLQLKKELYRPNLSHVDAVNDEWDKFSSFGDYDCFTKAWLTGVRRVMKDTGSLFVIGSYHNIFRIGAILQDMGFWILNDIVWLKNNPMPNFKGTRFCNAHETMIWASKSEKHTKVTFNYKALKAANEDLQMRSDWYLPICTGDERLKHNGEKAHTTQKPEALLHRVIRACSHPGDVVLDPFFGTGTTGAVAKKLRRDFIGIERETLYVELARKRIDEIVPPLIPDEMLPFPLDTPKVKIPFSMVMEYGLLQPGDLLRLGKSATMATVMDDGTLSCNGMRDSIHKLAARCLEKTSANGWEHWHYKKANMGEYQSLDALRVELRKIKEEPLSDSTMLEREAEGERTCAEQKVG